MTEIPLFYKQLLHGQETNAPLVACISHDEKPGAIGKTAPDPVPDTARARDCECKRHGTVTADLVTGHRCGGRPVPGVHRLSPSTGRQLPSRNQTSAGQARTETLACDLLVRVHVHAEARAEPRGVVLRQGGSHLASRSGFEGRTRGTRGTNKQPVAFKWTCKMDDTPAGMLFWNFYTREPTPSVAQPPSFAARADRDDQEPLRKAPTVGGTAARQTRFEAFFR